MDTLVSSLLTGPLLGAVIAAAAVWLTATFTARATERRETRARLFTERRAIYVDVLHHLSATTNALMTNVPIGLINPNKIPPMMAQMELLASPQVIAAHRAAADALSELSQFRDPDSDEAPLGSMAAVEARLTELSRLNRDAQGVLRDAMRAELGSGPAAI